MRQRGGTRAIRIGSNWAKCASARRLALAVSPACDFGLIGNTRETDASSARMPVATRMKALACFGGAVSKNASTNTLTSTSSALGGGNSSASVRSTLTVTPTPTASPTAGCTITWVGATGELSEGCGVATGSSQILRRSIRRVSRAMELAPPGAETVARPGPHRPTPSSSSATSLRSHLLATRIERGKVSSRLRRVPNTTTRELPSCSSTRLRSARKNRRLRFSPSPSAVAAMAMPSAIQSGSGFGNPFPFAMSSTPLTVS